MELKKCTIAIDGYSSTGKSTIAKRLANILNYMYVDSGAMYRAVTYFALSEGFIIENRLNSKALLSQLHRINVTFKPNKQLGFAEVYLNNKNIEKQIRNLEVSQWVSPVAALPEVRQKLVSQQQAMGKQKALVMDGRDIGSVVFPNAELKLFFTATPEIRAKRRYKELLKRGDSLTYEDVLKNVTTRDYIDSTRKDSPLIKANDAIEIDNSNLTIEEQVTDILKLLEKMGYS